MSFVLPRNVPKLTFTGSLKALGGEKRDRGRPAPVPAAPRSSQRPAPYAGDSVPTPYMGSRPNIRAEAVHLPPVRGRMDSVDDEVATVAFQRAEVPVSRGTQAMPSAPKKPIPVFNFQVAQVRPEPLLVPLPRKPSSQRSPLLAVMWIMASILAAMGSYKYAPQIVDSLHDAARALSEP